MTNNDQNTAPIRRLRRAEASKYLMEHWGLSYTVGTLAKLAVEGGGPRFSYASRFPLYDPADLDRWAGAKISPPVSNTSERRLHRAAV